MITALVLAGGGSSRMGRTKALLEYGGRTFLETVCAGAASIPARETIVVLGRSRAEVLAAWKPGKIKVAFNETPELGQISSVRAGLELAAPDAEAAMICLVDQPLIKPETYEQIAGFWRSHKESLVIPKCVRTGAAGPPALRSSDPLFYKRGHPILIPRKYFQLCFDGPHDKGLHWVTHHPSVKVLDLAVDDDGVIRDFDTPEEYQNLCSP
ncbi:MAG: nucleotidyltransferase family protein [Elusimicrobiales bacterium]|jgi:CTP:molybdopterin cytidylyltransferase MocA